MMVGEQVRICRSEWSHCVWHRHDNRTESNNDCDRKRKRARKKSLFFEVGAKRDHKMSKLTPYA